MNALTSTLTVPTRGAAPLVIAFFTFMLTVSLHAGILGLPALLILIPWLFKYCLIVGRQGAWGREDIPTLSMDNLSPFEIQPVALALGLIAIYLAIQSWLGTAAASIIVGLLLPAMVGALIVEDSLRAAFNPLNLLDYVRGLGLAYPLLTLTLAAGLFLCTLAIGLSGALVVALVFMQAILFVTFYGTGRILHAREDRIGYGELRPETSEERQQRFVEKQAERDLDEHLQRWHRLSEVRKYDEALQEVLDYARKEGDTLAVYATLHENLLSWRDPMLGLAFARHYGDKLLQNRQRGQALDVFLQAYSLNSSIRPMGERHTLVMAGQAAEANREDVALALLEDFEERFPESPHLAAALVNRARLLARNARPKEAARMLQRIGREHPETAARDDVKRLAQRVRKLVAN